VTDNALPILYSFRRCPYAMRSRMALATANIKYELREVVLRDKPEEMLAISTKGTVPVLQLSDGKIIDESLDVMYWSLAKSDPENWLQADEGETRFLIKGNDVDFKDKLDRYKYFTRYPEHDQLYYRKQAEKHLRNLEERLCKNDARGLLETRMTLADIAIFPFIRQFSKVEADWFTQSPFPDLRRWLKSLEEGELFRSIMKKYPEWKTTRSLCIVGQ
jgi:glutathione S-transferase